MMIGPERIDDLTPEARSAVMTRSMEDVSSLMDYARKLVEDVRDNGDTALMAVNREFKEDIAPSDLEVTEEEIGEAYRQVDARLVEGLRIAAQNITKFHRAQLEREMWSVEISEGILAGRMTRAMDRVGCYIPGGRAAYPSTVLMTVLPARVAGVREVVAVTPPGPGMAANPVVLVAADVAGCDRIFKVGGPWGIAAMAYGTETVPRVDKIVGPGNKYVTAAKMVVYGQVDIDSPVTTASKLAEEVCREIDRNFDVLPRKEILEASLTGHSHVLIAGDMDQAIEFTNEYAPEHLQILTGDPFITLNRINHAGSIFLGPNAPVPVGDYASGTNHVLPTGRCARMFSGLSVDDFIKKTTFQYLSREGLSSLKEVVTVLAEAEGLPIHAMAVKARFKQ
jgi:histidinol dehydrogenase